MNSSWIRYWAQESQGKVTLRFSRQTQHMSHFKLSDLLIPFNYADGGTWRIGDRVDQPFPQKQPVKPHLFQGNASTFSFSSVDGHRVTITVPEYAYQQLQDNREWGWKIFAWWCQIPFNKDKAEYTLTCQFDQSHAENVKLVDRFGQSIRKDFPGKITDATELSKDVDTEQAYYTALSQACPTTDRFGGYLGSHSALDLKKQASSM